VKLVAGEIAQASQPQMERALKAAAEIAQPAPAPQVAERGFFEYHLYEVQRPVTVKNNETKQIEFVAAPGVPTEKFYVYDGSQGYGFWAGPQLDPGYGANTGIKQVRTMLQFNTGEKGANAQLPKGVARVYQNDVDGNPLLVGENTIEHTPKGEDVRLYVGDAFDIVGDRVQTDFKRRPGDREATKSMIRNHKKEPVQCVAAPAPLDY
jgi:hypothetical protein